MRPGSDEARIGQAPGIDIALRLTVLNTVESIQAKLAQRLLWWPNSSTSSRMKSAPFKESEQCK
jgi:hypothetical protein